MPLSHIRPAVYGGFRRRESRHLRSQSHSWALRIERCLRHCLVAKAETKRPINGPEIGRFWARRSRVGPAVNGGSKTRKGHECPSTLARPRNFIERERGAAGGTTVDQGVPAIIEFESPVVPVAVAKRGCWCFQPRPSLALRAVRDSPPPLLHVVSFVSGCGRPK
jgi:hypothetical protein